MSVCPNCHNSLTEDAIFCPVCGTSISSFHSFPEPYPPQQNAYTHTVSMPTVKKEDPCDHTRIYYPGDVKENKVICMAVYLLDDLGIILALLAAPNSEYTRFHVKQSVKYCVMEALVFLAVVLFWWTFLVPIVAVFAMIILLVLKFISFLQVCSGKAVEPYLLRHIKFLK